MIISKRVMKYISIIITAAAVVALMFAVKRPAAADDPHQDHKVCVGSACIDCNHTDVVWSAWASGDTPPTSGTYYLSGDVTLTSTINVSGTLTVCLNGCDINGSVTKFNVAQGATLNICDCTKDEEHVGKLTGTTDASAVIVNGGTLNLYGGKISGNNSDRKNGGGVMVDNSGTFNMYGGEISGNANSASGGGVYIATNCTFEMHGGTISGNNATDGGGVYILSTLAQFTMYGGTISGNTASVGGGGVYVGNMSTFTMDGGTISGNTAPNGGGVYVGYQSTFTMSGGTISGNTANQNGGGVCVQTSAEFTMSGGEISGNTANQNGGGVCAEQGAKFTMSGESTTISGNTANQNGGGVCAEQGAKFTMSGESTTISGNTANQNGGGVCVQYVAEFTMSGGTISENHSDAGSLASFGTDGGGGVYVGMGSTFTMSENGNGEIKENTANNNRGGGVNVGLSSKFIMKSGTISGNNATHGGGVYANNQSSEFTMSGESTTISGNTATENGGGVYVDESKFTMEDGTISGNTAQDGGGVRVQGVDSTYKSTFTMTGGSISGNHATGTDPANGGGGVSLNYADFTMSGESTTISGNEATGNGGGVYVDESTFTMEDGAISNNTTSQNGGGVYVDEDDGTFTMSDGTISNNTASQNGGGVYDGYIFTMSGGTLSGNTATNGGGVYYMTQSTLPSKMEGGIISGNTVNQNGGGVYIGAAELTMENCTIENNKATDGGGVWVHELTTGFTIKDSTISENTVTGNGGGVCHMYVDDTSKRFTVDGKVTITGNYKIAETETQSEDEGSAKTDNNVCLYSSDFTKMSDYKKITIGSTFNIGESKIGVNIYDMYEMIKQISVPANVFDKTCKGGFQVTTPCSEGVEASFISDNKELSVRHNSIGVELSNPHDLQTNITKQPSCTEDGEKRDNCKNCDYSDIQTIPALGHDWGEWENDDDNHWKTCKNGCGTPSDEDGAHNFDAGAVTTPATDTTPGEKTYTCDDCGYQKTEEIPAGSGGVNNDPNDPGNNNSGGNNPSSSNPSNNNSSGSVPSQSENPSTSEINTSSEINSTPSESSPTANNGNPSTGIAISLVPLTLTATAFVIAAKRKNLKK